jgi:hypothetical protein
MTADPRVFLLSTLQRRCQEIPLDYARSRREVPDPDSATEIAPGVRVALIGTGDFLLPSGAVAWGAQIVVWADRSRRIPGFPLDETDPAAPYVPHKPKEG